MRMPPERIFVNPLTLRRCKYGSVEYVRADIYARELSQLARESLDREKKLAKLEAEVMALKNASANFDLVAILAKATPGDTLAFCRVCLLVEPAVRECLLRRSWDKDTIDQFMQDCRTKVEIAALKERFEWQPIETAPKDGTWCLIWLIYNAAVVAFWDEEDQGWYGIGNKIKPDEVTHWMPMPEPPKEGE
jgi:hypothetical protein